MVSRVSTQGRQVVEALDAGRGFRRSDTGWTAGALAVPDEVVAELARHDLVAVKGGQLVLTAAGRGWTARQARPEEANRLIEERRLEPGIGAVSGEARKARTVRVNVAESPLGWLHARGMVSERQFLAGERLRGDYQIAGLGPRVTMSWDRSASQRGRSGAPSGVDATIAQIDAKRRFDSAIEQVGGGLKDIVWRVICAGEGIEAAERALGWPRRAGKLVLTMGLDRVADFYRIG